MDTITAGLVSLDESLGDDKAAVLRALAARFVAEGRAADADALFDAAWAREETDATGLPGGIAIPHAKAATVSAASLAFARLSPGVDFGADDAPADIVFMIAAPDTAAEEHLAVLSSLARHLMDEDFLGALRAASDADEAVAIVRAAIGEGDDVPDEAPAPEEAAVGVPEGLTIDGRPARIVAVTACATGIAHTYMAADGLAAAAKKAGVEFAVEPQGSSGFDAVDPAVIRDADAVIFAVDVDVREPQRFAGKPVIRKRVKAGIEHGDELIAQAVSAASDPGAERVGGEADAGASGDEQGESIGAKIQRVLLTGVSYMIPFVAGGGLLMSLGFLLGGYEISDVARDIALNNALWNLPDGGLLQYLGAVAFIIGKTSMDFLVPALAGYIAFGMADRPGIAPGFVAGSVAVMMSAGFIGGIIGGVLAGLAAWWLGSLKAPQWLRGLMPVVIIPLLGSIFASGLMILFLGAPIAALMEAMTAGLNGLAESGLIVLVGVVLGLMMCFDLGGPVNKVAYAFAVAGLEGASESNPVPYLIMAAVMTAGMVPPLAMALASTVLDRKQFTAPERENGKAAWLLGLSFISEGAIPFAAADPLRVIPASMLGGAVAGGLSMTFGVASQAPHGGVFVFFAIDPLWGFAIALAAGTIITGFAVVALKRYAHKRTSVEAEAVAA
ncbi:PTS fructose transporter subunit IIABC [Microbacterium halophytorum]|uniref:PTS fructose transporter subunit IIABC n=1 Tax=Microbacterium halophytorum TaxID=2067568 RepID=UPI000CFE1CF4|nr:fructose-specific PTS transporter subunit EIIC [Microbacterium halophytorum]